MADHGSSGSVQHGLEAHQATYRGFVLGSVALSLICAYTLVALCAFAFISNFNLLIGFGGLIIGTLAVLVDLKAGGKWYISGAWLVIFGLIVAVAVS